MKKLKTFSKAIGSYFIGSALFYGAMECVVGGRKIPFIIFALCLSAYFVFTDGELF
jgi:hypothetical protein